MDDDTPMRDINTLLALETYQGMTDEEIESIIYYRVDNAITELQIMYDAAFDEGYQAGVKSRTDDLVEYTKNLLDELVAKPMQLEKVTFDG